MTMAPYSHIFAKAEELSARSNTLQDEVHSLEETHDSLEKQFTNDVKSFNKMLSAAISSITKVLQLENAPVSSSRSIYNIFFSYHAFPFKHVLDN